MTDTIDSHTDASGEPVTGTGSGSPAGAATGARTSTATLERPAHAPSAASPSPTQAPVPRAGALPTPAEQALAAKDKTLTSPAAVELARHALEEVTDPITVGEYVAAAPDAERLVTHLFDCTLSGYRGWRWAVTLSRVPRSRTATVCEVELLPGEEALLAPAWVPWAERLEPGDITRSDRLPRKETDERLEPGWEATGEDADAVALDELDLGRPRVLSAQGVASAAERWYGGDHGPDAEGVRKAHATCSTCGFFVPMAGALRAIFGVCANEWAADDGSVVSLDHGCGAHSETDLPDQGPEWPINPSRVNDHLMVPLSTNGLDLREGRSIAELAAEQADDVDGEPGGAPAEDAADVAGAPGQGTGTESPARDADGSEAQAEDGAAGTDAAAPAAEERPVEEPGTKTGKKPAASEQRPAARRSRRAATSTRRRRTADSPEEASEERSSRLVGLDLGELERAAAAASASSAPDAASAAESLQATADRPSPIPAGGESSDTPSERAASARAAVADLSLALGIDAAAGEVEEELVTRRSVSAPSARSADGRTGGTPQEEAFGVEPEDAEPPHAPRTLAELEAILPSRS
ncbi:hypothetical protein HMPREF2883_01260 [Actinomyces sp. HMSC075C01]|uniref:DUF3027 domain-containing protein n=1 Tax=Actinomyces TaxID=1654 RepID=UPI0008A496E0|nr:MULTISPECIES: DUF3027 domain-containing protein [Actinomyces]OFR57693.1 hypothetical protein HMPREF2883_01260 [Actinomyces sp. HMSC075C01]